MTRVYKKAEPQTSKVCSGCTTEKSAAEFYLGAGGRLRSRCKACYASVNADQHLKHTEKRQAYDKARGSGWGRSGREKWTPSEPAKWASHLKRTYGLSLDAAEQMFAIQQATCAICRQPCNRSNSTRLCVDHDHSTGAIRGLLCFQCNVGLGKFRDDPALLTRAATYLGAE